MKKRVKNALISELSDMLSFKRPARSKTEDIFIRHYLDGIDGMRTDGYGNRFIEIGKEPSVLYSCHTDTVHHNAGFQRIVRDGDIIELHRNEGANCLGADCSTGVWLMLNMIKRKRPGLYIFHRDEEVGGVGSEYIASKTPYLLQGILAAIAFDRKGTTNVITHQAGLRGASNAFAWSLADILPGGYSPDSTGVFTDTANYTEIIPECSNISVGYHLAHGPGEYQEIRHALHLLEALCDLRHNDLVIERDPFAFNDYGRGAWSYYYEDENREVLAW